MNDDLNPYEATGDSAALAASGTSGKAIAALILGITSFLCLLTGIVAIILGTISLSEISKSGGRLAGRGMAIAGIVLGAIGSVISIIAVLIALLLPAVQAARTAARRVSSTNNMKNINLALLNHESIHGSFPTRGILDENGKPLLSWRVQILPFTEEQALYEEFHLDEPWDSPHNRALIPRMPALYRSPISMAADGHADYVVPTSPGSLFNGETGIAMGQITDGSGNTVLVVEVGDDDAPVWTKPDDVVDAQQLQAVLRRWPGDVCMVGLADGSVRVLADPDGLMTFPAMLTYAGGEAVAGPE